MLTRLKERRNKFASLLKKLQKKEKNNVDESQNGNEINFYCLFDYL